MFMHASVLHLGGNMLYLWIFGNNIEDKLGPSRFIAFYFMGGIAAAYSHALNSTLSEIPMVGASGAVGLPYWVHMYCFFLPLKSTL